MKNNKGLFALLTVVLVSLSSFTIMKAMEWKISKEHKVAFSTEDAEGVFTDLKGSIDFNADDLGKSSFDLKVGVASINTGNGMKNKHAVSSDWFDAEKYPNISFKSKSVTETKKGYAVTGKLTIKDKSKEITIPFTFDKNIFKGGFSVDRLYFGVGTMEGKQSHVGQNLKIEFNVPVSK